MLFNRIREFRLMYGFNQKELADMAHCSRNTISSLETYQYSASANLALRLCRALDCKFEDLFYFIDDVKGVKE